MIRWFYRLAFHKVWDDIAKHDQENFKKNKQRPEIQVTDYAYLDDKNPMHHLNIVKKPTTEKLPLLIDIHGGGWLYGDKNLNLDYGKWFADHGFMVALPSYTLAFDGTLDQMEADIFAAIRYLIKNKDTLGFDERSIYLTGDSAGGHLAALFLAIQQSPKLQAIYHQEPIDISIRACYFCHPAMHLKSLAFLPDKPKMNVGAVDCFMSMICGKDYKSPDNKLYSACDLEDFGKYLKFLPPTLISSSSGDAQISPYTDKAYRYFKNRGFDVTYLFRCDPNFPHVHNVSLPDEPDSLEVNEATLAFYQKAH
jgi:acetyl esterase